MENYLDWFKPIKDQPKNHFMPAKKIVRGWLFVKNKPQRLEPKFDKKT